MGTHANASGAFIPANHLAPVEILFVKTNPMTALEAAYVHIAPVEEAVAIHLPVPQLAAIVDDYHCNYRDFENCLYRPGTLFKDCAELAQSLLHSNYLRVRHWVASIRRFLPPNDALEDALWRFHLIMSMPC